MSRFTNGVRRRSLIKGIPPILSRPEPASWGRCLKKQGLCLPVRPMITLSYVTPPCIRHGKMHRAQRYAAEIWKCAPSADEPPDATNRGGSASMDVVGHPAAKPAGLKFVMMTRNSGGVLGNLLPGKANSSGGDERDHATPGSARRRSTSGLSTTLQSHGELLREFVDLQPY